MTTRGDIRKIAYQYIVEQNRKLNLKLSRTSDQVMNDVNNISLNELLRMKEGLADPSAELVQALKKLLFGVTTGVEIDKYLVRSFQPKT